jgi:hypothetical protein
VGKTVWNDEPGDAPLKTNLFQAGTVPRRNQSNGPVKRWSPAPNGPPGKSGESATSHADEGKGAGPELAALRGLALAMKKTLKDATMDPAQNGERGQIGAVVM